MKRAQRVSRFEIPALAKAAILFVCLFPLSTRAASIDPLCPTEQKLRPRVTNCATNYLAVEASTSCMRALKNDITSAQAAISARMAIAGTGSASGQQAKLENTALDASDAKATLSALIKEANLVRERQKTYLGVISYPGGVSRAEARRFGLESAYESLLCFSSCEDAVKAGIVVVDQTIRDLENASSAAGGIGASTAVSLSRLGGFISPSGGAPTLQAKPFGKGAVGRSSSITGALGHEQVPSGSGISKANSSAERPISQLVDPFRNEDSLAELRKSSGSKADPQKKALSESEAMIRSFVLRDGAGKAPIGENGLGSGKEAVRAGDGQAPTAEGALQKEFSTVAASGAGSLLTPEQSLFDQVHAAHNRAIVRSRVSSKGF